MKTLQEWAALIDSLDVSEAEREFLMRQAREQVTHPVTPKNQATIGSTKSVATILPKVNPSPKQSAKVIPFSRLQQNRELVAQSLETCRDCDGTTCPKITDRWTTATLDAQERLHYTPCQFAAQQQVRSMLRSSKIPSRYMGKTLADYHVDEANRIAVKYAQNALKLNFGAYFFGDCGTGKTFLASIVAQEFLRAGKSVIFVKVPALLSDIQATFDKKSNDKTEDLLERLETADLVVLDDFGMEKPTQWAGATLCKILDMRYDNERAVTIITSNLSLEDLAWRLDNATDGDNLNGSRIADRCYENCKPILFKGKSRRR